MKKEQSKFGDFTLTCNCPYTDALIKGIYIGSIVDLEQLKPVAYLYPIDKIFTDPQRFQNRTDAFSELSAEAVEKNFNPNKFDPIVAWFDDKKDKVFVLSGHSRLEGMKRRKEKFIPIRFFEGKESDAMQFARIDANRAATKENLVEDLKAYKLARDGDLSKGIAPATPEYLKEAFRGKENILQAYSRLNPKGKFIEMLSNEDTISQFPRIQQFAKWSGALRQKYGTALTNTHEADIFNYIYGDADNHKIDHKRFDELIKERLSYGKDRLFPECKPSEPCPELKDFKELPPNGGIYKQINEIQNDLDIIRSRLNDNTRTGYRIYTDEEKKKVREVFANLEKKQSSLKRDLGILEKEEARLFGVEETQFIIYYTIKRKKHRYFSNFDKAAEAKKNLMRDLLEQGFKKSEILILRTIKV